MPELLSLCLLLARLGLFTFGGGLAIIPLLQHEMAARGLMTLAESIDIIVIAEMTPGPFAVNAATFVGMRLYGIPGAFAATAGVVAPSMLLSLVAAYFFFAFRKSRVMSAILQGVRPATLALITSALITTTAASVFPQGWGGGVDWPVLAIAGVSLAVLLKTKLNPIFLILGVGVVSAFALPLLPVV